MTLDEALKALEKCVTMVEASNAHLREEMRHYVNVGALRNTPKEGREALAVVKSFIEAVYVPAPTEPQGPPCGMGGGQ